MQEIHIPKSIELSQRSLNHILYQIDSLKEQDKEVRFDFSETTWINAELSVFLAVLINKIHKKGYNLYGAPKIDKVINILAKNGFLEMYGLIEESEPDKYGTVIPFKVFKSDDYDKIDNYLKNDVFSKINRHVNSLDLDQITENIFEIVHNVKDHSQSNLVLICGQWYPNLNKLSLAIADDGVTIPESFRELFSNTQKSDSFLVDYSTQKGVSTKDVFDSGLGLYTLKKGFTKLGELKILSKTGLVIYNENIDKQIDLEAPFPGTLIRLAFLIK